MSITTTLVSIGLLLGFFILWRLTRAFTNVQVQLKDLNADVFYLNKQMEQLTNLLSIYGKNNEIYSRLTLTILQFNLIGVLQHCTETEQFEAAEDIQTLLEEVKSAIEQGSANE